MVSAAGEVDDSREKTKENQPKMMTNVRQKGYKMSYSYCDYTISQ